MPLSTRSSNGVRNLPPESSAPRNIPASGMESAPGLTERSLFALRRNGATTFCERLCDYEATGMRTRGGWMLFKRSSSASASRSAPSVLS